MFNPLFERNLVHVANLLGEIAELLDIDDISIVVDSWYLWNHLTAKDLLYYVQIGALSYDPERKIILRTFECGKEYFG